MAEFKQHAVIWLQPWCLECEHSTHEGRLWCQDNVWGDQCEHCDAKPVKYILDDNYQ